jgi:membrane protease YdiL (CAAX protease family)
LTIPVILYAAFFEQSGLFDWIGHGIVRLFPALAAPPYMDIQSLMVPKFRGAWYLLGITAVSSLFNYLLGEELFFRGILLPRMNGAFGKWDWAVNGLLFAGYHLHKIEEIPLFMIGSLFYSYLNKRYRSFYPGLIIHGVEAIPLFLFVILFVGGIV